MARRPSQRPYIFSPRIKPDPTLTQLGTAHIGRIAPRPDCHSLVLYGRSIKNPLAVHIRVLLLAALFPFPGDSVEKCSVTAIRQRSDGQEHARRSSLSSRRGPDENVGHDRSDPDSRQVFRAILALFIYVCALVFFSIFYYYLDELLDILQINYMLVRMH